MMEQLRQLRLHIDMTDDVDFSTDLSLLSPPIEVGNVVDGEASAAVPGTPLPHRPNDEPSVIGDVVEPPGRLVRAHVALRPRLALRRQRRSRGQPESNLRSQLDTEGLLRRGRGAGGAGGGGAQQPWRAACTEQRGRDAAARRPGALAGGRRRRCQRSAPSPPCSPGACSAPTPAAASLPSRPGSASVAPCPVKGSSNPSLRL